MSFDFLISHISLNSSQAHIENNSMNANSMNKLDLFKVFAELLQYLNHSTNFFLYSFTGKAFREETKKMLCQWFRIVFDLIKRPCHGAKKSSHSKINTQL